MLKVAIAKSVHEDDHDLMINWSFSGRVFHLLVFSVVELNDGFQQ